ncbi:MAG TPA: 3-isopropylmalate dehydratase [Syntrophorhabdales bacterium]|nr:3-isopropylmalate dehydratase [Syntrophorhabdales bacterium]
MIIKGRARRFGDNIDTDTITPGSLLYLDTEELATHAFEPIAPDFAKSVREGDIIVGGNNFGCGSSREQATAVVKQLGIRYVVAESMARIYMRNCVALGLYPVISKGASVLFEEGDEIEIDFDKGEVRNPKSGKKAAFEPLSGGSLEIVNAGGILATLKERMGK